MQHSKFASDRKGGLKIPICQSIAFLLGMSAATIGVNIAGTYVFTGIFVLASLLLILFKHGISVLFRNWRLIDSATLFFLAWVSLLEIYNAISLNHKPNFGSIALWFLAYLTSWPSRLAVKNETDLKRFAIIFATPSLVVSAIAVAQMLRLPGVNELLIEVVRTSGLEQRLAISREIRATSLIGHQSGLGAYLCSIISLLGAAVILSNKQNRSKTKAILMWIASFVGQLATVTFATTAVSIIVSISIAIKVKVKPWMIASATVTALVGWGVFGSFLSERMDQQAAGSAVTPENYAWLPETIGFRVNKWIDETIPAAMQRPMTGWGYGVYESADNEWPVAPLELQWMSPESEWFRTMISAGLPSLILQILMLVILYRTTFKNGSGRTHLFPIKVFFLSLLAACFIHSHLTGPGVVVALWAILGATWEVKRIVQHSCASPLQSR